MEWSPEQKMAITHSGHNILVSAGAGSGKTAVLSERVLEFVKSGWKLENFLILTFTNLAAGEMKDRIRSKLTKAKLDEASNVDTADICTFDSFAAALVKKNHFLLGLSPNLMNVDSTVISVLKRNIIDEMFERHYQNKDKEFEELIDSTCFKTDDDIKDLVLKFHSQAELALDKNEFFNTFVEKHYSKEAYDKFIYDVENILINEKNEYIPLLYDLPSIPLNKKTEETVVEKALKNAEPFMKATSYEELIDSFYLATIPTWPRGCDEDNTYFKYVSEKRNKLKEYWFNILPRTREEIYTNFEKEKKLAEVVVRLTKELDTIQWEYKMNKQIFEFNDIAKFALKLVKENDDLKENLKKQYRMIMIDEYQDTSSLQEEFISLFANNNVYMVGDIKQSIYAFRNAESSIFKGKYDLYKRNSKKGEVIDMKDNFRSRKEVLDDINKMFSVIMKDELGGANYKKDHIIGFGNGDYEIAKKLSQNYNSEFILYPTGVKNDRIEQEIIIIAEDIINKINNHYQIFVPGDEKKGILPTIRDATFKDFCILMDRGTSFEQYKKVFTDYQIPLYIEANENIKDNDIVRIIKSLLVLVKCIKNQDYSSTEFTLAFLSLGRSFVKEYSDEYLYNITKNQLYKETDLIKELQEVVNASKDLSSYLLIEELITKLDIYHKLVLIGDVKKNERYLDKFMEYFRQMSDIDYSIEDFITYLENIDEYNLKIELSSSGVDLDSVKIMNIHKSKGLEFPVVYFPGLTLGFNRQENKQKCSVSKRFGFVFPTDITFENGVVRKIENYYSNLDDLSEKIRLLYVSLTRAREKMIFLLDDDFENLVNINKCKSFADLLKPLATKLFNYYHYEEKEEKPKLMNVTKNINKQKISLKDVTFDMSKVEIKRASKDLKLGTNKVALDLGTHLHEILEVIDFVNPDYSIINNPKHKEKIENFLKSDLLENVSKARIYKEYEFATDEYRGIIDLLLIYEDHVDIIDYKTKNIDDEAYDNQLEVYRKYISSVVDLPINLYLYSIIDCSYRRVD